MPVLSRYEGYIISMRLRQKEHNPPHLHVSYGNKEAMFSLEDGEMLEGMIPRKGQEYVKKFILHYKDRLMSMWETQNFEKLPSLN